MASACQIHDRWTGEDLPQRLPAPARGAFAAQPAGRISGLAQRKKKPAIVEIHTVKRIDNSRLVRHVEPAKMRNLYRSAALGGIVAVFFMMYIYQHFRCIDLSFQLEDLRGRQSQAAALNGELKLEIATLRDPHRIDVIARHQLGLARPEPAQVREYAAFDGAQVASAQLVRPNRAP
ncbi:MAG TPA: cell division protein FtsL [Candidatus Acidoferrum sp.]